MANRSALASLSRATSKANKSRPSKACRKTAISTPCSNLSQAPSLPVRLLHHRDDHGGKRTSHRLPAPHRRTGARLSLRELVPLWNVQRGLGSSQTIVSKIRFPVFKALLQHSITPVLVTCI